MIRRELTEEEIEYCKSLPDANSRKSYVQSLIIAYFRDHPRLLVTLFTRGGKGFMCTNLCKRIIQRNPQAGISAVLYTDTIRREWKEYLKDIPGATFSLMASYAKGTLPVEHYEGTLLIIDEAHHCANPASPVYSKAVSLSRAPYKLLLSATITAEQREFLFDQGITHEFHIPLKLGVKLGMVPPYQSLNIAVELTDQEKAAYVAADNRVMEAARPFEVISATKAPALAMLAAQTKGWRGKKVRESIAKRLAIKPNQVLGLALLFRGAIAERATILYECSGKPKMAQQLLEQLSVQRTILFGTRLAVGDELARINPKLRVYRKARGKDGEEKTKQLLANFYSGLNPYLYGCNSLNEGLTVNNCSRAINVGISSSIQVSTQRIGRLLGIDPDNPDKEAKMLNLYVPDFMYNGKKVFSQELKWLKQSQYGQLFISWPTTLAEAIALADTE